MNLTIYGARYGDFNNQSETAEFNLIKSVTAVPSRRKATQ